MEDWKTIDSKGITLIVSNTGKVRVPSRETTYTRTRNGKTKTFSARLKEQDIAPQVMKTGYIEVSLRLNGVRTRHLVHRLVALAFCPGYQDGLCVNHINGVKTDNRAENLEWVSLARNTQHAWETGLVNTRGDNQPSAKLTSKRVAYIRKLLNMGISAHTIAIVAGVSNSLIDLIRDGKRWAGVEAAE